MTHPARRLRYRLGRAGIEVSGEQEAPPLEMPWFVRTLQAFSGWLAALFLLGFIAMGVVFVIESSVASAVLGGAMIAGAYALLHRAPGDFVEHLALAASLAGQLLVAWALVSALEDANTPFWWGLLVLQGSLALAMPSLTHRTFSAFAASLAFYLALTEGVSAPSLAGGLVLLAATALWLNEFRWPARLRSMQAWGYGLLLGLLAIQAMEDFGHSLLIGRYHLGSGLAWLEPWVGDALGTLALLLLLRHVFQRHTRTVASSARAAAYGVVAVLMLASLQAHGLTQGAVVVALGFAIGNRLVMGLGGVLLLLSITSYYYWLDATLLIKALTLLVLGVLLLAIRWALRHWWRAGRGEDAGQ
ncbi:DUF4401 domain-containing protein [Halomonas urumqiensis]|uniref:DUF4401 domain-containing protein n=1 Tax=Halomonas urumqiensis TaxID=1684789 RepID=A0A2N7UP36_9GAMM|nr:DUF4401 domain-containing protein [Halomonas urumqiensis]PMR82207.1 DUF4401 domain-containing protein [Halomonas urumqiensis]PTB03016.1 DUF4401 domain-containing protein [Halomonas urumqiensis]GHE20861.1 hypothetical protein GCM10017767_13820 [Halomonas urumqiensis]